MPFFRSSRERRIDRALSSVLNQINEHHEFRRNECETWRELDSLSADMDAVRRAAYKRAERLHVMWHARVMEEE